MKVGAALPLYLQLFNPDGSKHVRATCLNASNAAIAGSPVTLTHVSNGLYSNTALTFPAGTAWVIVQFEVYDDSGFTTPSDGYGIEVERFDLDTGTIDALGSELVGIVENGGPVVGIVEEC